MSLDGRKHPWERTSDFETEQKEDFFSISRNFTRMETAPADTVEHLELHCEFIDVTCHQIPGFQENRTLRYGCVSGLTTSRSHETSIEIVGTSLLFKRQD